jgi:hypothetical protein
LFRSQWLNLCLVDQFLEVVRLSQLTLFSVKSLRPRILLACTTSSDPRILLPRE